MSFLYKADPVRGAQWAQRFAHMAPDLAFRIWPDIGDPEAVRYLAAWQPPDDPAVLLPNIEVVFSVGAGIDQFDLLRVPAHIPVVRMIEPGIVEGTVEYVTQAVLMSHRDLFDYAAQKREQVWRRKPVRAAAWRRVGVFGLGTMRRFGFPCAGWSCTPRTLEGIDCYAGDAGFDEFLAGSDILICLMPLTDSTRVFDALLAGASLVQVGRGPHLDEAALLAALASGRLDSAILDVTDPEPLPAAHPFWAHPRIRASGSRRASPARRGQTRPSIPYSRTSHAIVRASRWSASSIARAVTDTPTGVDGPAVRAAENAEAPRTNAMSSRFGLQIEDECKVLAR